MSKEDVSVDDKTEIEQDLLESLNNSKDPDAKVAAVRMVEEKYYTSLKSRVIFLISTIFLLFLFIIIGASLGAADISLKDVFLTFLGKGTEKSAIIIFRIRVPRVLSAVLVGLTLSITGAAIQTILRNPLGSPFTLGLSPAASFGAAFAVIILGAGSVHSSVSDAVIISNPYIVTITAFSWCIVASTIILILIKVKDARPETIILIGVIVGSLFNAGTTALEYFADTVQLSSIIYWTFGDLSKCNWDSLILITIIILPCSLYFIKNSVKFNALNLGDDVAKSLGIDPDRIRITSMVIISLMNAVVISFFGIIAFVGLVVPHIVRRFIGSNEQRYVLIGSGLFGGLFLLIADTLARTIISPLILPVGVLTSFIGAPLFIYLLVKRKAI
ncbi:MAG: FecCD family ABC transporter permease [Promethearchaeota archaeon]